MYCWPGFKFLYAGSSSPDTTGGAEGAFAGGLVCGLGAAGDAEGAAGGEADGLAGVPGKYLSASLPMNSSN